MHTGAGEGSRPPAGADDAIGWLLDGIADEVHRETAAEAAEIRREFAAAMREALRRAPRHELAAILAALKRQRRIALAYTRLRAAMGTQARRQRLIMQARSYLRDARNPSR